MEILLCSACTGEPKDVYKRQALACPTLSHMDPYFIKIMDEIKSYLQQLMNTTNELTVPLSTSGSGGMEATFVNIVEKGDKILVLENGSFSERMIDVAGRLGAEVTALHYTWGTPIDVDEVAAQLKNCLLYTSRCV